MNLPALIVTLVIGAMLATSGVTFIAPVFDGASARASALAVVAAAERVSNAVDYWRARNASAALPSIAEMVASDLLPADLLAGKAVAPGTSPQTSAPFRFVAVLRTERLCEEVNQQVRAGVGADQLAVPETIDEGQFCLRSTVPIAGGDAGDFVFFMRDRA